MLRFIILSLSIFVGFITVSCKHKTGSATGPAIVAEEILSYQIRGNQIIMTEPASIDSFSFCSGNQLNVQVDSNAGGDEQILQFVRTGSQLTIYIDTDMLNSGAEIAMTITLTGPSTSTGIQGLWTLVSYGYEVLSGNPTPEEILEIDTLITEMNDQVQGETLQLRITSSQILVYGSVNNQAEEFVSDWENYEADMYNITAAVIGNNSVRLTGHTSGEIVTITFSGDYDMTYTSSNAANMPHTYYENPTSCPNDYQPAWYNNFLRDNALPFTNKQGTRSKKKWKVWF